MELGTWFLGCEFGGSDKSVEDQFNAYQAVIWILFLVNWRLASKLCVLREVGEEAVCEACGCVIVATLPWECLVIMGKL